MGRSLITFRVEREIARLSDLARLAERLAPLVASGGLVLLEGALGAGKTTLAKAIGQALGISEGMSSPTFDLLHVHSLPGGLTVYHVDGYRLEAAEEWDVLDLPPQERPEVLILAEWGEALVPDYPERLEIRIERQGDDRRRVTLIGIGERWARALRMWDDEGENNGISGDRI